MNNDIEQRLSRLTPCGLRPDLRGQVLGAVAGELQPAPKEHGSPSPGQRPGEIGPIESALPAQRANPSANAWPVGPTDEQNQLASPGRRPGLGERLGLRPTEPLPRNLAALRTKSHQLKR